MEELQVDNFPIHFFNISNCLDLQPCAKGFDRVNETDIKALKCCQSQETMNSTYNEFTSDVNKIWIDTDGPSTELDSLIKVQRILLLKCRIMPFNSFLRKKKLIKSVIYYLSIVLIKGNREVGLYYFLNMIFF